MDLLKFVLNWQKRLHTAVTAPLSILFCWPSELPVEVHGSCICELGASSLDKAVLCDLLALIVSVYKVCLHLLLSIEIVGVTLR